MNPTPQTELRRYRAACRFRQLGSAWTVPFGIFLIFFAKKIILMPVSVAVFDTWPNTAVARPRQETFKARTKMHRHAALTEPLQPSTSTSLPSALFRFTLPIESHCSVTVTLEPWQGDQNKGGIPNCCECLAKPRVKVPVDRTDKGISRNQKGKRGEREGGEDGRRKGGVSSLTPPS